MTAALFRMNLPGGTIRWARGTVEDGPRALLPGDVSLDVLLAASATEFERVAAEEEDDLAPVPDSGRVLAPVESQEVWAAGVTYERSRNARMEESAAAAAAYDLVYDAPRPEIFFKAPGWRVRGPAQPIGVRADSSWNVPEPELAIVVDTHGEIAAYTIGNDISSRSIEGENPLYLPQAKIYDHACALGPALVPRSQAVEPFGVRMTITRNAAEVFRGQASTTQMRRTPGELAAHLYSALTFPVGAVLMTGTTIVPDPPFTLTEGDLVRISISGLGELVNPVRTVGRPMSSNTSAPAW